MPLLTHVRAASCLAAWWLCLGSLSPSSMATEVTTVAGHTLGEYAEQLNATDRVQRLRAARSLAPFGDAAASVLRKALEHDDAAVRFIAAEQLGRLSDDARAPAVGALCELAEQDSSRAVRLAASFALCRHGLTDMHLSLLVESLQYPERGMACTAAYLIGEIGPDAAKAEAALQQAYEANQPGTNRGDYHIGGAALSALRKVRTAPKN